MTKRFLDLNENEAALALHTVRFYMNAKGSEVSDTTKNQTHPTQRFLSGTEFVVTQVENVASILGARGGTKGGASTSAAKKAAAMANGAKGGRPHKPNLFIKFSKSVWSEPDQLLLNELYKLAENNKWLPDERGNEREGPYVRIYVPAVGSRLEKLLRNSMKRVKSGLAAAKARGKRLGRQPGQRIKSDKLAPKVIRFVQDGVSYRSIATKLKISKTTVTDIVKRHRHSGAVMTKSGVN